MSCEESFITGHLGDSSASVQGDHLSGKLGNVRDDVNSQGIVRTFKYAVPVSHFCLPLLFKLH